MKDRKWWKNEKCGGFLHAVCFSPHRTGSKLDDFSFFHQKKKKKRKETNCMASLEWLWFWSCLWGGRIWPVYKVTTLLVADMKRFSVRLTLSPLKSTCYIQMLLRFPPLCLHAAAYLSDRGRCCGFQSGGGEAAVVWRVSRLGPPSVCSAASSRSTGGSEGALSHQTWQANESVKSPNKPGSQPNLRC